MTSLTVDRWEVKLDAPVFFENEQAIVVEHSISQIWFLRKPRQVMGCHNKSPILCEKLRDVEPSRYYRTRTLVRIDKNSHLVEQKRLNRMVLGRQNLQNGIANRIRSLHRQEVGCSGKNAHVG